MAKALVASRFTAACIVVRIWTRGACKEPTSGMGHPSSLGMIAAYWVSQSSASKIRSVALLTKEPAAPPRPVCCFVVPTSVPRRCPPGGAALVRISQSCERDNFLGVLDLLSLEQHTAPNNCPCERNRSTARSPASIEKSPTTVSAGLTGIFARCRVSWQPCSRTLGLLLDKKKSPLE
jgi:hypothetical protein